MKLIVFSDSHQEREAMRAAVAREKPDMIIHLGDHADDALAVGEAFPGIPLHAVRGNCDYNREIGDAETLTVEGRKLFMTHGHLYGVKNGLSRITDMGKSANADLVMFGHTHFAYIAKSGGMTLFNPGTVRGNGRDGTGTYGTVVVKNQKIKCEIRKIRS
jgi:hypothetical protein